jgi:ribonucleoside-diphosphate reductase alpha chain
MVQELASLVEGTYPEYVKNSVFENSLNQNQTFPLVKKYLMRDDDGNITEKPGEALYRMSRTMAEVETQYGKTPEQVDQYTKEFFNIMDQSLFSPAGRIWTNAGTDIKGLFNCYVLPVEDNLESIFESVKKAAIIHKNGGGTGYNFSELRPRGTYVKKSKGIASGPVSFITQFDRETEIINSGNRRGANMGILDVNHPDILDFIYAKSVRGELQNFNVSVGIYDDFMQAAEKDGYYTLKFNDKRFMADQLQNIIKNVEENKLGGSDVGKKPRPSSLRLENIENILSGKATIENSKTNIIDSYSGNVAGKVNEKGEVQLSANYILDVIAKLAWETADPGMIFLDSINKSNPLLPTKGYIKATNPCGEQPLHPYDACNLGSIILSSMVKKEEQNGKNLVTIDYTLLEDTVKKAVRFMDNVNDANKGPIKEIEETVLQNRRIGLGVMGWADMLAKLGIGYDSEEAYTLGENVMSFISDKAKKYSVELATEKGIFPNFKGSEYDNGKLEDRVRNVQRTTIAPTGTISMVYNVSSGIEPFFAIAYQKNIRGGDSLFYVLPQFEEKALEAGLDMSKILPLIAENKGSLQGLKEIPEYLQKIFRTSMDIDYKGHVLAQASFQKGTDNAVSKTINMPNNATISEIKNAYLFAWKNGLKGITVYRDGSKDVQVLETGKTKGISALEGTMDIPIDVPNIMPALKIKQKTTHGNLHTFVVYDPVSESKQAVEVFGMLGNAGSDEAAAIEAMGRNTSLYLRSGGKIERIKEQYIDIGSGGHIIDRAGHITSLPMGFGVALEKYLTTMKNYNIEDIVGGKIDMRKLSDEVADYIRKGVNGNDKSEFIDESNYTPNNTKNNKKEISENPNKKSKSGGCPECGGILDRLEGCMKCRNPKCGYSAC